MTILNQDVILYAGDTATLEVSLTDANGDPFVLSAGGTIKYRLAETSHDSEEDLVAKELGAGILLEDSVASIALDKTDTLLGPGVYYHELKVFDSGDVATAMVGAVTMRRALDLIETPSGIAALGGETAVIADGEVV